MEAYLKQLINWRKNNPVIATGKTLHFAPFDVVYVYFRYNKEKLVMVVMYKNKALTSIDTNRFAEILNVKTKAKNIITNDKAYLKDKLEIAAKLVQVFEIE